MQKENESIGSDPYCAFCDSLSVDALECYFGDYELVLLPLCKDHLKAAETKAKAWEQRVLVQRIGN